MNDKNNEKLEQLFRCDVVLTNVGYDDVELIRLLRTITGKSLDEIKNTIARLPVTICENLHKSEAKKIRNKLSSIGASADIIYKETHKGQASQNITKTPTYDNEGCLTKLKKISKPVFIAIDIVIVVALIYFFCSGKSSIIINDFLASDFGRDFVDYNPYIQMVQDAKPTDYNTTYKEAYSRTFDSSEWEYFKSDEKRVVQVVSTYEGIDDELITQFLLTPTDENGQFWIEVYAMRVSGQDLNKYEMGIVMAAIFENEVLGALQELFLYGTLFN